MIDLEEAKRLLDYDRETGVFRWAVGRGGLARAGSVAGSTDSKGYRQIRIFGRYQLAHRLAWAFVHGSWPGLHIDHVDRNPQNNAIANLRLCTHAQNHQNTSVRSDSTSGVTGVSYVKRSAKWLAYINREGKRHRLGLFETCEQAIQARLVAKPVVHTFHPIQEQKGAA
jgi:hypothetical protein